MKNILLVLILMFTSLVQAQEIRFGFHGGVNFANADYEQSMDGATRNIDTDLRVSSYFGGFAEYSIPGMEHKLQSGLSLNFNGYNTKDDLSNDFKIKSNLKITQINLPVILKFNSSRGVFINAGVYLGAIIDVEEKTSIYGTSNDQSINSTIDLTSEFKTFDFGLSLGAEYNLDNGLFFEFRFNSGLRNILKDRDDGFD
ncbi:MAG: PorT family protein, partial [Flavobacteriaceae bacterium]|nr:PorT family protein [Flavobacteriaceae bacterium]